MDNFERTELNKAFDIASIITIHYFEYSKDYCFEGEEHNFWEMVYADKGDINIYSNSEWHSLNSGYVTFHKPMQFHNLKANGVTSPNVIVISFECNSELMSFFDDKTLYVSHEEKEIISHIIYHAKQAFTTRLNDPYTKQLIKSGNIVSEQYINTYLEQLLLLFYSKHNEEEQIKQNTLNSTKVLQNTVFSEAASYMLDNINSNLTINEICSALNVSVTKLKRVFHDSTGLGIISYFRHLRIERAKELIRNGNLNITQIADCMGYESIHHFSKQFKLITGMSPREYSLSIKMWVEDQDSHIINTKRAD